MIFEYEKPVVEIVDFFALERLARDEKNTKDGDNADLGNGPSGASEGVQDGW